MRRKEKIVNKILPGKNKEDAISELFIVNILEGQRLMVEYGQIH